MTTQQNSVEFSNAVSQLTLSNIFFTALLYNLKVERDDALMMPDGQPGVACTDGVRLKYRADTFASMFTAPERVSVLAHEILHVILFHPLRRGIRDPLLWNVACDLAVNQLLKDYDFAIGKGWLQDDKYKGLTAEQIYDKLLQNAKSKGGQCDGQGQGGKPGPTGYDVMDYDPTAAGNEGKTHAEVEREIGISTEKALQAAKAAGKLPSGMKKLMEDAQVVREPWYQHLRRYFTSLHARQYNWSRLDTRRAVMFGVCSPQMKTESMGVLVAAIDESGSMSDVQRAAVGSHLKDLCRECHPKALIVIQHDSHVQKVTTVEGPDYEVTMERVCCGGTDFRPVFERVADEFADAQAILMFTDKDGPVGDVGPAMDVIWVSPCDREMPFGENNEADFND